MHTTNFKCLVCTYRITFLPTETAILHYPFSPVYNHTFHHPVNTCTSHAVLYHHIVSLTSAGEFFGSEMDRLISRYKRLTISIHIVMYMRTFWIPLRLVYPQIVPVCYQDNNTNKMIGYTVINLCVQYF